MFTTDRLILREFRDGDLGDLMRLANNAEAQRGLSTDILPRGPDDAENLKKSAASALMYVIVALRSTGEFMGFTKMIQYGGPKNRDVLLGIGLMPEYWDKGYGTEATIFMVDYAFRWLGQHRVSLGVKGSNSRAIALYKKVGFQLEGTRTEANYMDGKWEDMHEMGVLEDEWAEKYWKEEH